MVGFQRSCLLSTKSLHYLGVLILTSECLSDLEKHLENDRDCSSSSKEGILRGRAKAPSKDTVHDDHCAESGLSLYDYWASKANMIKSPCWSQARTRWEDQAFENIICTDFQTWRNQKLPPYWPEDTMQTAGRE